jgi:Arc/MetJ-type ribon-helix-helix transcriptional regulator
MTLTLDAATERRIQREIELGHYADVAEVVSHAVTLLVGQSGFTHARDGESKAPVDEVFGLWSGRHIDGLAYQEKLRAEW